MMTNGDSGSLATTAGPLYWLVQSAEEALPQSRDAPPDGLLNAVEISLWRALRTDKRRRDWLIGRLAAKQLVAGRLREQAGQSPPLDRIAVLPHPDGWPIVTISAQGAPPAVTLSISHSHDWAFCAIQEEDRPLGADIELVEMRSAGFVEDYFTPREMRFLAVAPSEQQAILINAIWSGKEAALKAIRRGLAEDTRIVSCLPHPIGDGSKSWLPMRILWNEERLNRPTPMLIGWWRPYGDFVLTLAAAVEGS
jgi:4'-phosphopantetheinyl transferase